MVVMAFCSNTAAAQEPATAWEIYNGVLYELNYETGEATAVSIAPDGNNGENPPSSSISILDIQSEVNGCMVTRIGDGGFSGLENLKSVWIPTTVTSIGERAFANSGIQEVRSYYGTGSENQELHILPRAFASCEQLEVVHFYNPLAEIGEGAFNQCHSLSTVNFDYYSPVTTLSRGCFNCCTSLTQFTIPRDVTTIGDAAFGNCASLNFVDMPSTLTTIGKYAFADCASLSRIILPSGLETIDEGAFVFCNSLTTATIPNSVTSLGKMAFAGCRNMETVRLSNTLSDIGPWAFFGCYALTGINIPNSVKTIGERAFAGSDFRGAYNMDYANPHLGILTWGTYEDYGSMQAITIGSGVETVGEYAFVGHPLQSVTVMAPIPPVLTQGTAISNPTVFDTNNFGTAVLYVPRVLVNDYTTALEWERFTHIEGIEVMGNGDIDGDGNVGISDATTLLDMLLGGTSSTFNAINADIDGDGELTINDVTQLIDKLLNGH